MNSVKVEIVNVAPDYPQDSKIYFCFLVFGNPIPKEPLNQKIRFWKDNGGGWSKNIVDTLTYLEGLTMLIIGSPSQLQHSVNYDCTAWPRSHAISGPNVPL